MRPGGGATVRAEAARALTRVVAGRESLAALYAEWQDVEHTRDTALLRALVTAALRWHQRLDWQLGQLLARPLGPKDATLSALLRIGLVQLQEMRIPDHAAVAETVAAATLIGRKHSKALVNAVLRSYLREREALEQRMRDVPEARDSHPLWLIEAAHRDWPEAAPRVLEANNRQAPLTLRVNRTRSSVAGYLAELDAAGIEYKTYADSPAAVELLEPRPAAAIPGFLEGRVSIQDRAAQRAVELLDLGPGMRVLDACAAPGGKTAYIRETQPALAALVAVDADDTRLGMLRRNLARLGLEATVQCADAALPERWWDGRPFDRILLDAPCTAVGVIRRHPDIKLHRVASDVDALAATQRRLLERLWPLLTRRGLLVYAVCSFLRAETNRPIGEFLRSGDAVLAAEEQRLPGEANCDGFYYACLKRRE